MMLTLPVFGFSKDGLMLVTPISLRNGAQLAVEITDQIQPAETEPVEVENVGDLERLDREASSHYNTHIRDVLFQLAQECPRWRRIRGDGNCFYRAYIVGIFEQIFTLPEAERSVSLEALQARHVWNVCGGTWTTNISHLVSHISFFLLVIKQAVEEFVHDISRC